MWHEARRQERKIRGMLVDYRRRAERRRDFYEKIKADPTQFLQIHGRSCKIHLDPAVAGAAESPATMMPWQGQTNNMIDRFDVRAHLDYIPPVQKEDDEEIDLEERQLNYERYRIIAQNSFLALSEEKFLKQLHLEEQFGYTESKKKDKPSNTGAAIGFNYEDGTAITAPNISYENNEEELGDSDSDLDVDLAINVSKLSSADANEMNRHGRNYGMSSNDFYSFLINDLEEAETYRLAKEEEHEKALFSGRKSRRERRAHREKRLANRVLSPPSYAARTSPTYSNFKDRSVSKSPTPDNTGKITYITSFGGDEEQASNSKPTYADKVKMKIKPKTEVLRKRSTSRSRLKNRSSSENSRKSDHFQLRDRYRKRSRSSSRLNTKRARKQSTSSSSSSSSKSSRSSSQSKNSRSSSSSKSDVPIKKETSPKVVQRYYGRKRSDQSSSEPSESDDNSKSIEDDDNRNSSGNKSVSANSSSTAKVSKNQLYIEKKYLFLKFL